MVPFSFQWIANGDNGGNRDLAQKHVVGEVRNSNASLRNKQKMEENATETQPKSRIALQNLAQV